MRQLRGEVLLVQPLLAELVELDFTGEVSPNQFLYFVTNRWLEVVLVDLRQQVDLVEVHRGGTGEELRHVPFQHGQGCVEILQYSYDGVLAFDGILGTLQGSLAVEGAESGLGNVVIGLYVNDNICIDNLQALFVVSTEEQRLPTVVSDAFVDRSLSVGALWVTLQDACLEVFLQPAWIRKW